MSESVSLENVQDRAGARGRTMHMASDSPVDAATSNWPGTRAAIMLFVGCAAVYLAHVIYLACVAEDAHITFRFARNLAEGHGFVWNAGERPIEGFTSFLWVLLTAAGFRIGINPLSLTQVVGVAAALGTLGITFAAARRLMGAGNAIAAVPCLMLAASGPFATWAASGMEMTSFGFCALLGTYAYLFQLSQHSSRWLLLSGVVLCVGTLLRPEGVLFFGVLAGLAATVLWPRTKLAIGAHLLWVAAYVVPLAMFLIWRLQVFGDPLPNTFYQKTGGGFWQHARGAGYVIYFGFYYLIPLLPFPALVAWERGYPTWRDVIRPGFWIDMIRRHPAASVAAILSLTWLAAMVYVGGDYMAMYRFMVPILPFIYLLLVPMLLSVQRQTSSEPHKQVLIAVVVMVAAAATIFPSTPFESSFYRVATWQHGNYRGVQSERRYVERFSVIGRFFERYRKSDSESLATRAIGAIGYHAPHLAIHDLSGLTDRHIARIPVRASNRGWAGHEKWDLDYSFHRLPTYLMFDENFAPQDLPVSANDSAPLMADAIVNAFPYAQRFADWIRQNPEFIEQNYRLKTVWMEDVKNGQTGYFAFLERINGALPENSNKR
jgi:arabinofuranosyltransferase